jgi:hypothetical protein
MDEHGTRLIHGEDFGPAIEAEEEHTGSWGTRGQLSVDVVQVRPADDPEVEATCRERLDEFSDAPRACTAVWHCRPVPVENGRLETAREGRGKQAALPLSLAARTAGGRGVRRSVDGVSSRGDSVTNVLPVRSFPVPDDHTSAERIPEVAEDVQRPLLELQPYA